MPVPTTVSDLSVTASSNYPAGSEGVGVTDDYIRAHASIIKQVSNAKVSAGVATGSGLTVSTNDRLLGRVTAGSGAIEEITCTAAGRALLDDADAAAQRTTLGLTSATQAEMEAGTETNLRVMTPQGVKQAIDALGKSLKAQTAMGSSSGTSVDFTAIPSTVKNIKVVFADVSLQANEYVQIRIGASSVETTSYTSVASNKSGGTSTSTGGFAVTTNTSMDTATLNGTIELTNLASNMWVSSGNLVDTTNGNVFVSGGRKNIGGALSKVSVLSSSGTTNFDGGTINVLYE